MPHKDPEKRREYMRKWAQKRREEDPEFVARNNQASREHQRRKRQADPESAYRYKRDHQLKSEFGISLNEYEEILGSQNGVCAICKQPQEKTLCVDHCHKTGVVRGLLCDNCNNGLGRFGDNPEILISAIDYLTISELNDDLPPMPFTNDLHRTPRKSEIAAEAPTRILPPPSVPADSPTAEMSEEEFIESDPRCTCAFVGGSRRPQRVTNSDCPIHRVRRE